MSGFLILRAVAIGTDNEGAGSRDAIDKDDVDNGVVA